MTLAIISDIHGNLPALEAVLADINARGITRVVNLGDHVSGPLWPRETAARLMAFDWPSIAGNHDRVVVHDAPDSLGTSDRFAQEQLTAEQHAWLAAMPATATLPADDLLPQGLYLCHGIPTDDRIYLLETPEQGRLRLAAPEQVARRLGTVTHPFVVCGHSHIPRIGQSAGTRIVNPGSVGLPAYTHDGTHAHVSETGSPLARYAIVEPSPNGPRISFIAVEYDVESAAARAAAHGRPDWVVALRTGYADRQGRF